MTRILLLVLALLALASPASAAAHACANGVYTASADITIGPSNDTVALTGTSGARCLVLMNGFRFMTANGATNNNTTFQLKFVDIWDCGDGNTECIGQASADNFYCNACTFTVEDSTFHSGGGIQIYRTGSTTTSFQRNRVFADNTLCVNYDCSFSATNTPGWWHDSGTSTEAGTVASNRFDESWIYSEGPNMVIGHTSGGVSTCTTNASKGNIVIGERAGISIKGANAVAYCNISYPKQDISPAVPYWADVENVTCLGGTYSYNVIIAGQWQTTGMGCANSYNLYLNATDHHGIRASASDTSSTAHHLLFSGTDPTATGQRYGDPFHATTGTVRDEGLIALVYSGNAPTLHHITADLAGRTYLTAAIVGSGASLTWRSNLIYGLTLASGSCPGSAATSCSSAIHGATNEGYVTPLNNRLTLGDYNNTYFDSGSSRKLVYGIGVSGLTVGQNNFGQHDLGTVNGQGSDPLFRGALPIACGPKCHSTGLEGAGLPFNDRDIQERVVTWGDIWTYYQWVYSPQSGSPLRGAASPTDGSDDIGAFLYDSGSTPSIVSTNKRPYVWAGKSFTNGSTMYGSGTNEAYMLGFCADDALPSGTLTAAWTLVNGPGTVTIENSDYFSTRITNFSATGTYTLRLTCSDGTLSSRHDVQYTKP